MAPSTGSTPSTSSQPQKRRGRPPTRPESIAKHLREQENNTTSGRAYGDSAEANAEAIENQWRELRDPDFFVKNNCYVNGVMFYGVTTHDGGSQSADKQGKPIHNLDAAIFRKEHMEVLSLPGAAGAVMGATPKDASSEQTGKNNQQSPSQADKVVLTSNGSTIAIPRLIRHEDSPPDFGRLTISVPPANKVAANGENGGTSNGSRKPEQHIAGRESKATPTTHRGSISQPSPPFPADAAFNKLHPKIRGAILFDIVEDDEMHGRTHPANDKHRTAQKLLGITKANCEKAARDAAEARQNRTRFPNRGETAHGLSFLQSVGAPLGLLNLWTEQYDINVAKLVDVNDGLYDDVLAEMWESGVVWKGKMAGFMGQPDKADGSQ